MQSYWDLTDREKTKLTDEQIRAFCDVEMMAQGVLKPVMPEILKQEAPDIKQISTEEYYEVGGILFQTRASALEFLKLKPYRNDHDYQIGYDIRYASPVEGTISVVVVNSYEEVQQRKSELAEWNAKKEARANAQREYNKACEKASETTAHIWEDYHRCLDLGPKYQRVRDTYAEYLVLSNGDRSIARGFLRKAFDDDTLAAAQAWFGDVEWDVMPKEE